MTEIPNWLNSTLASDAAGGEACMVGLQPLRQGQQVAGLATTVTVGEGDNMNLREAVLRGPDPGHILVIAGSPNSRRAVMGDLVARWIQNKGFRAVILDGRVRDVAEIRALGIQVWCRGATPVASRKEGGGSVGGMVHCAGIDVSPGDLVIADDDGVIVWSADKVEGLLLKAGERLRADQEMVAKLVAGGDLT